MKNPFFLAAAFFLMASPAMADYRVTGSFLYEDREFNGDGFTGVLPHRPIRLAEVRIMAGAVTLATGSTNVNGDISITVPGSVSQPIRAVCIASGAGVEGLLFDVRVANNDDSFGDIYSVSSIQVTASGSGFVDTGATVATANTDAGKAFNIWDVVLDGLEFLAWPGVNGSFPTVRITALWRQTHPRTGSFYRSSGKFVYIGAPSAYNDTVIAHEFGHFIDDVFSKSDSPGGTHFIGDGNQDIRLAWSEGLATFLGSSIRKFKGYSRPDLYVSTDGTVLSFSYEIEKLGSTLALTSTTGSTNEIAVTATLWDITDGPGTHDVAPGSDDDPLERPFAEVWEDLTRYLPTVSTPGISIEDFWDGWFSPIVNNGFLAEMEVVFAALNGVEFVVDAQESDNVPAAAAEVSGIRIPPPASGAQVIINEIDPGSEDALELYNAGSVDVNLTGWRVVAARPGFPAATFVLPSFQLKAGAFVVLSETAGTNTSTRLYFGGANNISWGHREEGSCALLDNAGQGRDFVRWHTSSEPPPPDTSFTGANPAAPAPGRNLARHLACLDTDSGNNWGPQVPTLGKHNISGQEKHGTFYPAGDLDYASFVAVAGARYLIETVNLQNGADTLFDVVSADALSVLGSSEENDPGRSSTLVWTAAASGKTLIRIRRFDGPFNRAAYGSYDFRVIELSQTTPQLTFVFPQIAAGSGFRTTLIHFNAGSNTAAANVMLAKSDGSPLPVDTGQKTASSFQLCLEPGGLSRLEASNAGFASGYARVVSNLPVYGTALFRTYGTDETIRSEAAVGLTRPTRNFTAYVDNLSQALSGYALANIGPGPASVTLALRDRNGSLLETTVLALAAGEHRAEFAFQRFPSKAPPGFEGSIEFTSDREIAAIALRFDNPEQDVFSTIPVLADDAATTLYFPQAADGGGYRTNFILINPTPNATSARLDFFTGNGQPMLLPIGGVARSSYDVPLSPRGTARFVTDGTSTGIVAGWVRVSSSATLGGSAIFQTVDQGRIRSQAGVAASPAAGRFLAYVDSRGFAESGVAISNPNNSQVSITLRLKSATGATLATTSLVLPPLGHVADFFTRWFPLGFDDFEGTLEVEPTAPVSAVALRYDNLLANVFATLPVVVVP